LGHKRSTSLRSPLRGVRPPRLELDRPSSVDPRESSEKPRIGTTRTASEPRPFSKTNARAFAEPSRHAAGPGPRRDLDATPHPDQKYSTDSYEYSNRRSAGWGRGPRYQPPPQYIDEEEEEEFASELCDGSTLNTLNNGFEIVGAGQSQRRDPSPAPARYSRPGNPRRAEIQKFRTKVHAPDDTRYIMIGPTVEFGEFENRIREKFGFKCPLKMKVQDDGDMITMVDQEDLDLLIISAREVANREGSGMGKIEVSFLFP
jgi:hypothetical protein